MVLPRLITAAAGIPVLVFVIFAGGYFYTAFVAIVLGLAVTEFLLQVGLSAKRPLIWIASGLACALPLVAPRGLALEGAVLGAGIVLSLAAATLTGGDGIDARFWPVALAVAVWVGWLGAHLSLLRAGDSGRSWVLFLLFTTFASDTMAYATGRLLGRHRMAPRISPGKTWEGAAGGVVGSAVAAVVLVHLLRLDGAPGLFFCFGVGLSIAAQLGDLSESALKRSLALKDAGRLVPGHGGLLDRLDSLLLTGFVVYWTVKWISL